VKPAVKKTTGSTSTTAPAAVPSAPAATPVKK
jgi:hypothetical protein